jgi:hypothetical protein
VLLDWQADVNGNAMYRVAILPDRPTPQSQTSAVRVHTEPEGFLLDTGPARFEIRRGDPFPFRSVSHEGTVAIDPGRTRFRVEDEAGRVHEPVIQDVTVEEPGPLRVSVHVSGQVGSAGSEALLELDARLHFFAGSSAVRFVLTLRNPRRAEHPGGMWDLGDPGSVYLRDAAMTFALPDGNGPALIRCSPELAALFEAFTPPLEVYQDSSGGENWKSSNHLNRNHEVPITFRGYRLRATGVERRGLRATPAIELARGGRSIAVTMPHFWQNFPKALEATEDALVLRLFPKQFADLHEIQGGELKTHTFVVAFGPDAVTGDPLAWAREPLLARAAPEWYCSTGALPYLTPRASDPHREYLALVDAAIEGDDTFDHKREVIDEYGWRHFGDIYGDHEAVSHEGPSPLVSHYNNQYDPVAGFAYQFLRSGDARWWRHMDELAWHVLDIDIYHTGCDKSAYNHGLFWHTFHYVDADTATHRTYPGRHAARVQGGGPAGEHNYTTGLMLHHFLTGNPASREAALGLARWVIDMDDGRKTVFRWLAGGSTGLASKSRSEDYHGPGRGSANSVAALLDACRLSGNRVFLEKAEQLIRRVVHPTDDIASRVALRDDPKTIDAENRWFYTMFLQSLGKYLDCKAELGQLDDAYPYARASLLHYARWMAENEYPYLDKPHVLEYPTETWAAQDLRKGEVFLYAAMHAAGEERTRFLERAEFFFHYSLTTLSGMKTRTLARPVVLLLTHGWMWAWFHQNPAAARPNPPNPCDFGPPEAFVPQKALAKRRAKQLAALAGVLGLGGLILLVWLWMCV